MDQRESGGADDALKRLSAAEKWIWRSVAALAVLLVLSQLALRAPAVRALITPTAHWEGTRYRDE